LNIRLNNGGGGGRNNMTTEKGDEKKKAVRTRRKTTKTDIDILSSPAKDIRSNYCRKCMRNLPAKDFFVACDKLLDSNGKFSVCRYCVDDMYNSFYVTEKNIDNTILKLCRILNVKYDSVALEATKKQIDTAESKGKTIASIFGIYRKNLVDASGDRYAKGDDLIFQGDVKYEVNEPLPDSLESSEFLKEFWGDNLDLTDYIFLEREFAKFKETHKSDTYAEKVLLKLVCFKLLDIAKARSTSASTTGKEKELQELMKNLAISPQYAKAVTDGKSLDAFGVWIAEIEREEPAQWLEGEGRDLFHDVADVEGYFQKYFVRPLKNAILQSKDFNVDDEMEEFEEYDSLEGYDDDEEYKTLPKE
jgi:hypothetical protein